MEHYQLVPRPIKENLEYRLKLRDRCARDERFKKATMQICKEDVLFWMSAFCWIYEPRPKIVDGRKLPNIIPFIPWDHQIPIIKELKAHLGYEDVGLEKSRGEGMSWIAVLMALHDWVFVPMSKIGLVSRNLDMADNPEDPDSLGWKALTLDTRVLTPYGWVQNGDLKVGDLVVGSDGLPTRVTAVHDHGVKPVYRVTFRDGTQISCCGDHLWSVTTHKDRLSGARFRRDTCPRVVLDTKTMAQSVLPTTNSKGCNYQVALGPSVEFFEQEPLPIPPYTLGALLGDGHLTSTSIGISGVDDEIIDRVTRELPECVVTKKERITYSLTGGDLSAKVRSLGLRECRAWEKFIPQQYLHASQEDRWALLQGIMDTDGWIAVREGARGESSKVCLEMTSDQLVEDVSYLARSLGCLVMAPKSYLRTYTYNGDKKVGRQAYRISIVAPFNPFYLKRKADKYRPRKITDKVICAIEPDGEAEVRCITVDADDHLYMVEGFTLTHNCAWELEKLPKWMVGIKDKDWTRNVSRHAFVNLRNGAAITAHSATENVGRGGRYSWFLMDELASFPRGPDYKAVASTQHATNSRLYVSTPEGSEGAYFEIMHTPSNLRKLRLHWSMNPTKNRGLYKIVKGQVVVQDPENNPLPPDYQEKNRSLYSRLRTKGYNLEKGWRSPWYDKECDRPGATPQFIAQELDLDYAGSKHLVFGNDFVAVAEETVRPPLIKGTISVHPETLEVDFERSWEGTTDLWIELDHRNRPPAGNYVIGCDISSGLGGSYTSNSVLEIFDLNTKEQVLEFATNIVQPQDFADIAIGVARWFWDAYLAWEIGGPGHAFTGRVMKNGYGNVYYRTVLWKSTRSKKHKEVGWQTDAKSKQLLIADLITQIKNRELVLRSKKLLDETRQYIMHQGEIKNAIERTTQDDSSKGASHGDRVIALGVAVQAAKDRPSESLNTEQDWTKDPPENTVAYRYKEYLRSKEDTSDGWVDRTNGASTTAGSSLTVGRHDWGD